MSKSLLYDCISQIDEEVYNLIKADEDRQRCGINLIASENYTSVSVLQANASVLTNKYSEGLPYQRYYGGTEYVDAIETVCQSRALKAFGLNKEEWGVNVQPHSGSPANFEVYTALLKPGAKLMGLNLSCGGHLTHGHQTATKKISASSYFFTSEQYKTDEKGFINYDDLEKKFREFKPELLICGASAYPRDWDYKRLRKIADINNAYLMCDMAHISGFIATKKMNNPFEYCDIVTTTTHKTLRGPRGAMIFYKKQKCRDGSGDDVEKRINFAVFPMSQGGPHNQQTAGIAVALKQVCSPEYSNYINNLYNNTQLMCRKLILKDYNLVTGGTDCHIVLIDLRNKGLNGSFVEKACEYANIYINKNSVPGETNMFSPCGIRIGLVAATSRGFDEQDVCKTVELFDEVIGVCQSIVTENMKLDEFMDSLIKDGRIEIIKEKVKVFASAFPMPCLDFLVKN
ncbi:Serine hydroxymethyltransferase 2 [Astathelohania contejeani]|uniref:Serine hydroxymethyltransferase n=1 Tax=Astathelohania contejeani TaxID=164912 RepID=A0ABQ7HW00_9MICR|nr:Serine hydroxymethyltransferase 2 [Thelohania contejeani]